MQLWVRRYEESGDIEPCPGWNPITYTDSSERHRDIVVRHINEPFLSTRSTATAYDVSLQTVRRHLKASKIYCNR